MAVAVGTTNASNNAFTSSITLTKPAGTVEDDLLIMGIIIQRGDATVTTPSGWTALQDTPTGSATSADAKLASFYKVAGGSEPADYTVNISSIAWISGAILRLTGADTTTPIPASGEAQNESVSSLNAPAVSTTTSNGMFIILAGRRDGGGDIPTVSGYTNEDSSATSNVRIDAFSKAEASAGSSGTPTVDWTNTQDDAAVHIIAVDAAPAVVNVTGTFQATADFSGSLGKDFHFVSGQFTPTTNFSGELSGDLDVSGVFEVTTAFFAEFYKEVSGEFRIAIDAVNTGYLKDHNITGQFSAPILLQGTLGRDFRVISGEFRVPIRFRDGYVGKGTGLTWTFPSSVNSNEEGAYALNRFLSQLREGDEFPGYFPLGGVSGKTARVRVVKRRYNDSLETPDLEIQLIEYQDPALIRRLREDTVIPFTPQSYGNMFRNIIELKKIFRKREE